ncbi:MAG: hypothetical protein JWO38_2212 [Gemmataceae bacterium]|nr:hypothetical protein [Gemmataceae bacterium]
MTCRLLTLAFPLSLFLAVPAAQVLVERYFILRTPGGQSALAAHR